MKNINFMKLIKPNTAVYLWSVLVLVLFLAYYNIILGLLGALLLVYLVHHSRLVVHSKKEQFTEYVETLSFDIDNAITNTLIRLPLPMVMLDENGVINWYNPGFTKSSWRNLAGSSIKEFIGLLLDLLMQHKKDMEIKVTYADDITGSFII